MGIGFNFAMAMFGGTAPFIGTLVTAQFGIFAFALVIFGYASMSLTTDMIVVYLQHKGKWNQARKVATNDNQKSKTKRDHFQSFVDNFENSLCTEQQLNE